MLQNPEPEDWLSFRRTLDAWGYSPLDQIARENVARIRMAWTRAMDSGSAETTPLAYDGVLYVANAQDVIQALSAETGDLIWEYRRDLPEGVWGYTGPLARKTRNIAIWGEYILGTSADLYAYALDAVTGELAWETRILDYKANPAHHSAGPIVADGKLISGRSCRPLGGPDACVILAHDAQTGRELWRRRTLPAPGEPGDETWGAVPYEDRRHVGTWMPPSYDPDLELVYIGTGVTAPAPKFMLGGADLTHLYHNSTLALDVSTGEIRWYYQHLNDSWDLDHVFERILVDTVVAPAPETVQWINPRLKTGEVRKVVTGIPGKTGLVYTLDRATGEFLWATPTVPQNVIIGIDGATGEVSLNEEVIFRELEQVMFICPSWAGGKDWEAGAYSPLTRSGPADQRAHDPRTPPEPWEQSVRVRVAVECAQPAPSGVTPCLKSACARFAWWPTTWIASSGSSKPCSASRSATGTREWGSTGCTTSSSRSATSSSRRFRLNPASTTRPAAATSIVAAATGATW